MSRNHHYQYAMSGHIQLLLRTIIDRDVHSFIPGVTNKVGGDHILICVTQDSFQFPLRLLPENQPKSRGTR